MMCPGARRNSYVMLCPELDCGDCNPGLVTVSVPGGGASTREVSIPGPNNSDMTPLASRIVSVTRQPGTSIREGMFARFKG